MSTGLGQNEEFFSEITKTIPSDTRKLTTMSKKWLTKSAVLDKFSKNLFLAKIRKNTAYFQRKMKNISHQ